MGPQETRPPARRSLPCDALERKYVNKLLLGHRDYRERKGRGKGHTPADETLLVHAGEGVGCPCAKYLKSAIGKVLDDLGGLQNVREEDARQVRSMSAPTVSGTASSAGCRALATCWTSTTPSSPGGYLNPKNPGRPCHNYQTYAVGRLRLVLGVEGLPDRRHADKHGAVTTLAAGFRTSQKLGYTMF